MKNIACTAVGGPAECSHSFTAANFDEFMTQAHEHFGSQHSEMVNDVSEEDKQKWVDMARGVVDAAPDA